MLEKIQKGLQNPNRVLPYIYNNLKLRYLRLRYGQFYTVSVNGVELTVNLDDAGVSHQLVRDGIREPITTEGYTSALESKFVDQATVNVLDIGANIGYYALQPPALLGDKANVIAIEPVPENVSLLRKNVEQNGFDEVVTIVESAVATEKSTLSLYTSTYSNLFTPSEQAADQNNLVNKERFEVEAKPLIEIINKYKLNPADVDVLRLDVDGYEHKIFESAQDIINESEKLLINLELHPSYLTQEEMTDVIELLSKQPVEIISSSPEIDDLTDCYSQNHAFEVVLWRG